MQPTDAVPLPERGREQLPSAPQTSFDRARRMAGVVLAPLAFAGVYLLTGGSGLTAEGRTLSATLATVAVLWVSETIPLPVTALVGAILSVVLGVAPARQVLAHFADPIIFLFMGGFMLARAMEVHGLDRRIALSFLSIRWVSAHPARMLGGFGLVTAALSMWVSNTATAAMMLPIALGILGAVRSTRAAEGTAPGAAGDRRWPFATGMMLMVAYAASIGGIGTPVGSPPNLIGIGLIRNNLGVEISFFTWMALATPMLTVMSVALFLLLYRLHPESSQRQPASSDDSAVLQGQQPAATGHHAESKDEVPSGRRRSRRGSGDAMRMHIERERAKLGPWTRGQLNTLVVFGIAVALWTAPGFLALFGLQSSGAYQWFQSRMPEAMVALLAAVLLFFLPIRAGEGEFTLTWEDAVRIDWGTILLFGGGLALGTLMFDTGVATAMGEGVTRLLGASSTWGLTFAAIVVAIILSEATSNTAAANMVIPVVIAIAQATGVNPVPPALGACFGASFGFMLPVSTPPNAIAYGSGLVPIQSMMRAGVIFDLTGLVIIWVGLRIMCPLLGLS